MKLTQATHRLLLALENWNTDTQESRFDLVETAEEIEEAVHDALYVNGEPIHEGRALAVALDIVSSAHHQLLPVDVPVIRKFLDGADSEGATLLEFEKYWEGIDWDARKDQLDKFWWKVEEA